MKPYTKIIGLGSALMMCSCANTGFIGHRVAYDVNAEIKSDLSAPVAMNVGFESHSAVAVPPQKSLNLGELISTGKIAGGEVLPTISRLSIQRQTGLTGIEFDYVTITATGDAAENATSNKSKSMAADAQKASATKTPDAATNIATSSDSIE